MTVFVCGRVQQQTSVKTAPWKAGEGDLVKEVSKACQKYGLKFGIYLSPWDCHAQSYGSGQAYNDFYLTQLMELLTNYGEIFSVWLDGANGEGPNEKKQQYDWERINQIVRHCIITMRNNGNLGGRAQALVISASLNDRL